MHLQRFVHLARAAIGLQPISTPTKGRRVAEFYVGSSFEPPMITVITADLSTLIILSE